MALKMQARVNELEQLNQRLEARAADLQARLEACADELERSRERWLQLADTDPLTGLANRKRFAAACEIFATDALHGGSGRFAVMIVDLDRFRTINDSLGHEAADVLLRHVAIRLFSCAGPDEVVARLGGDEFALLMRMGETDSDLERIATEVLQVASEKVIYRGRALATTCSIGIARFPVDGTDSDALQRHAFLALDRAKADKVKGGSNGAGAKFALYDPEMERQNAARQALGAQLADAIRTGQIEPWFQPIYEYGCDGGPADIVGAEALARWRHPTRGLLTPNHFLDLAEERGLMHELFACMLRASCPIMRRRVGDSGLRSLSINMSPSQFIGHNVAEDVIALLDELDLPPAAVKIEITEEVLMQEFGKAVTQLEQLARHGVRIALDDFGVGYSNIDSLRRLSFHSLKVDRSLIADVVTEPKVRSILKAIHGLAEALGLTLVAEGVETQAQATLLASLGFARQQGYFHGRPMPSAVFEQVIMDALGPICVSADGLSASLDAR